jgi:hypothetical protein
VASLAGALATLLGDAVLRRRMGQVSREIAAGHAMGATLDAFEAIYDRVAGRGRPDVPAAA